MPPWPSIFMPPSAAGAPGAAAPMAAMGYSTSIVPACSNLSVAFAVLPCCQRLLKADEHHVQAGRLERDGFARLYFEATFYGPHLHHAVVHGHGVNLTFGADVARHAGDAIRCLAVIC